MNTTDIINEIKIAAIRGIEGAREDARNDENIDILNKEEAAAYLKVTPRTIQEMEKAGSIHSYRVPPCKKPLYKKSELYQALKNRRRKFST